MPNATRSIGATRQRSKIDELRKELEVETIKQRLDGDCAVCVTAMFLGKSYDEIVELFPESKDGFPHGTHSEGDICRSFGVEIECVDPRKEGQWILYDGQIKTGNDSGNVYEQGRYSSLYLLGW